MLYEPLLKVKGSKKPEEMRTGSGCENKRGGIVYSAENLEQK
jgi:hypothetical protein